MRALALALPDAHASRCWGLDAVAHRPPGDGRRVGRVFFAADEAARTVALPLPRAQFVAWFGAPPARPRRGERAAPVAGRGPFAPHPWLAWNAWVVADASDEAQLATLAWAVREAYGRVVDA